MENEYFTSDFTSVSQERGATLAFGGSFQGSFAHAFFNSFFNSFSNRVQYLPQFTQVALSVTLGL